MKSIMNAMHVSYVRRIAVCGLALICGCVISGCGSNDSPETSSRAQVSTQEAEAGILELNITNDPNHRNGEPEIAVNPKDPKNLVYVATKFRYARIEAGDQQIEIPNFLAQFPGPGLLFPNTLKCVLYHSMDGGHSWQEVAVPLGKRTLCPDPMVVVDSRGVFYVAFDWMGDASTHLLDGAGIGTVGVIYSLDGGRHWSDPVPTNTGPDRPFFRLDARTGKLYLESGSIGRTLAVSDGVSDDDLANPGCDPASQDYDPGAPCLHFTKPVPAPTDELVFTVSLSPASFPGTRLAVHDGILVTAAQEQSLAVPSIPAPGVGELTGALGGPTQLIFHVSTDDGKTFTAHPVLDSEGNTVTGGTGEYVSADPTQTGRFAVMQLNSSNEYEIYITPDAGETWTGPTLISPGPGPHKPWMDYGPTGILGVLWKTSEINVYSAVSFDGGATFSEPLKVTSASTAPEGPLEFAGDDLSWLTLDDRYLYGGWGDTRTGFLDSYFAKVPLSLYQPQ